MYFNFKGLLVTGMFTIVGAVFEGSDVVETKSKAKVRLEVKTWNGKILIFLPRARTATIMLERHIEPLPRW